MSERSRRQRTRGVRRLAPRIAPAAAIALAMMPRPGRAQDAKEAPSFPYGAPVVLAPVQSVAPFPDGRFPGDAATEGESIGAANAELAFAFAERRGAENWAMPAAVIRRAERNPLLRIDPERLAFQGLLTPIEGQIYEPLHGQLRTLAALFDARFVVLPVLLRVAVDPPAVEGQRPPGTVHAVLRVAMIDVRRSQVLWQGDIAGPSGAADSPALLARLAAVVARRLAPS
ncbi:MAG: hypothetical protein ACE5HF_08090 [Gemmatimonadota bacterium]